MMVDDTGAQMGKLSIEHFENPNDNKAETAIQKILAETAPEDRLRLLRQANAHSGKVSISPEYDKCGNVDKVDITFHPLWSFRTLGKDLSISLPESADCKAAPLHKGR